MTVTLKGIRYKGERHGQHGSPGTADEQERDNLSVLVRHEWNECKADTTDEQTQRISQFRILEPRQHGGPYHTTHGLNGIEYTGPVTSFLIGFRSRVGGSPHGFRYSIHHIGPHVQQSCPAEELYQSHSPESGGSILQQLEPVTASLFFLVLAVIHRIFLRRPLLHLDGGIDHTENENGCTYIERPDHGIGYNTFGRHILQSKPCEHKREEESYYRTGVAQERLDGIGLRLLFLIHHVAYQHLERLHGHVDTRI